jgi:hypothetical protein
MEGAHEVLYSNPFVKNRLYIIKITTEKEFIVKNSKISVLNIK